jgi:hypothetical protein
MPSDAPTPTLTRPLRATSNTFIARSSMMKSPENSPALPRKTTLAAPTLTLLHRLRTTSNTFIAAHH